MNRRQFLRAGAGLMASTALAGDLYAMVAKPTSALRLLILHTNDTHSHLDPMEKGEFAGMGGVSARAMLLREIRGRSRRENILLFDAGDILQGTPYFNLFQGEPEIKAMNALRYDAATLGNHEFDAGIDRLAELVRDHARFPFLNCNYDLSDTPLQGHVRESMIIDRDGARVGVLGLGIKLEGLVFPGYYGNLRYRDPIADAQRVARQLKEDEKCDFVIALSHLNIESRLEHGREPGDRDIIREVPEINLVIGGHNHWLLREPEVRHRKEGAGYVAQAGWAGTHLGFLRFDLYDQKRVALAPSANIVAIG